MAGSAAERQLEGQLLAHAASPDGAVGVGLCVQVLVEVSRGVWRGWFLPFPVLLEVGGGAVGTVGRRGAAGAVGPLDLAAAVAARLRSVSDGDEGDSRVLTTEARGPADAGATDAGAAGVGAGGVGAGGVGAVGERLRGCLAEMGLGPEAVELFAVAAATVGALGTGADLARVSGAGGPRRGAPGVDDSGGDVAGGEGCGPDLGVGAAGASAVLGLVGSLTGLTAHLEGALVGVVGDLSVRTGRVLLERKGVRDPGELTADQGRRWRARAKSATRREIEAVTGWGQGEVSDLVALANAPASVRAPVVASMSAGVTPWRLARRFLREVGHQAHEDTADVADRLFGTDPDTVCTDRLDPDGALVDGPWEHKRFHRALEGEAARLASRDPHAQAQARAQARARRDVKVTVHEDGTGTVSVSGTASQVTAVADRFERAARTARGLGDPRTLDDLRADLAMSLLLHAGLALPDPLPADADEVVRTAWTEQMRTVLAALPPAVLNVIVPFDALVHSPHRPLFGPGTDHPAPAAWPEGAEPDVPAPPPGGSSDTEAPAPGGSPGTGAPTSGATGHTAKPPPRRPRGGGGEVLSMGMVTGAFAQFLTPDAVRELALTPGTTLHRLLMDPADGRCVERSISAYAPDAAMRAQVHAADVTCRAPGCVRHATYTQLDHVTAHGAGGPTSETNLQSLDTGHHDGKTHGGWEAVMAPNRDVTWTSLLGRIYRTRTHDHRQYSTLYRAAVDRVHADTEQILADDRDARARARAQGRPTTATDGRGEPRQPIPLTRQDALADAVDRAVYRALTYRGPARPLRAGEDHPDTDTDPAFLGWETITLTRTTTTGQRRYGPDPTLAEHERHTQQTAPTQHHPDRDNPDRDNSSGGGEDATRTDHRDQQNHNQTNPTSNGWRHDPDNEPPPF